MPTPAEILAQMNHPSGWDGWCPTFSGAGYKPWSDTPGTLSLDDLAYGLAHTFRYGGHSDPAVTVAEHCLLVTQIIQVLWPGNPRLALAGLFHDASESVLHDIQSPLRKCIAVTLPSGEVLSWDDSDKRVSQNIAKQFGITAEELDSPEVRAADVLASCFEKRDCPNLRPGEWGLPAIPPEAAHLKIEGFPPETARGLFKMVARLLLTPA